MLKINKLISTLFISVLLSNSLIACNARNMNFPALESIEILDNNQTLSTESKVTDDGSYNNSDAQASEEANTIESFIISTQRRVFNEYDTNRSGTIELSELPEAPVSFAQMDKDKNKRLTFNEVMPLPERVKQMTGWITNFYKGLFKLADTDANNKLSNTELADCDELAPFKDLGFWKYSVKGISIKSTNKYINQQQFNVMMNNLFLNLHKKYTNYKNTAFATTNGKLPVMLVQGYAEPSWYFMYGIYNNLKDNGWEAIYPVNLFPNITDIKEQAAIIASKIEQVKKEQGVNKVDYVSHSMGGLIGRYYIQNLDGGKSVQNFVSIATPHYGTNIAFLGIGEGAKQMRPGSEFMTKLNSGNYMYPGIKYTSIWTKTDEIIVPAESALLRGSILMPDIKYTGHLLVMWAPDTYKQIRDTLTFN
jgi:pimeloyl-ACP methyl ester carboxylesterase